MRALPIPPLAKGHLARWDLAERTLSRAREGSGDPATRARKLAGDGIKRRASKKQSAGDGNERHSKRLTQTTPALLFLLAATSDSIESRTQRPSRISKAEVPQTQVAQRRMHLAAWKKITAATASAFPPAKEEKWPDRRLFFSTTYSSQGPPLHSRQSQGPGCQIGWP